MDNLAFFNCKTDLADESSERSASSICEQEGIKSEFYSIDGTPIAHLSITDDRGERTSGRKCGEYVTLEIGSTLLYDTATFEKKCDVCADRIGHFLERISDKSGAILLAGLGNPAVLADAVGAETVRNFIVTRHIKQSAPQLFEKFSFCETAACIPDVFGNTGVEAAQIIRGIADDIHPAAVIAVDALSSRKLSRLAAAVQITDSGVCPGSGVGNRRAEISYETLGVPVIAIGVPTVVNSSSLLSDAFSIGGVKIDSLGREQKERLRELVGEDYYVAPKNCASAIKSISRMLGYALNKAVHGDISYAEMRDFL